MPWTTQRVGDEFAGMLTRNVHGYVPSLEGSGQGLPWPRGTPERLSAQISTSPTTWPVTGGTVADPDAVSCVRPPWATVRSPQVESGATTKPLQSSPPAGATSSVGTLADTDVAGGDPPTPVRARPA